MSLVKKQADRPSRKAVTLQLEEQVLEQAKKYQKFMNYSSLAELVNDIMEAAMKHDRKFSPSVAAQQLERFKAIRSNTEPLIAAR